MSIAGSGNFFAFDGLIAQAGNLADGALQLSEGIYAFAGFDTGLNNAAGPAEVNASIDLLDGVAVTVSDLFGDAGGTGGFPLSAFVGKSYSAGNTVSARVTVAQSSSLTLLPVASYISGTGTVGGYDTLNIGLGTGGTGLVEVTGEGSRLSAIGAGALIRVGAIEGTGVLAIDQGGQVETFALQAGNGLLSAKSAIGRVTVDGPGSLLSVGAGFGSYVAPAALGRSGTATFGLSDGSGGAEGDGRGYLTITNGGVLRVENVPSITDFQLLRFGRDAGTYGYGLIDGVGSTLNVVQHGPAGDQYLGGATLDVGQSGQGRVIIQNGASVEIAGDAALLGISRMPSGPQLPAQESHLSLLSGSTLTVDAGAHQGGIALVGSGADAAGRLTVSGVGTALTLAGNAPVSQDATAYGTALILGREGSGIAEVSDGAMIAIDAADDRLSGLIIGQLGGSGTLTLDAATITLTGSHAGVEAPRIVLGEGTGSQGDLILRNGARLENLAPSGVTLIAPDASGTGSIEVTGSGTTLVAGPRLLVGATLDASNAIQPDTGGDGTLALRNQAIVEADEIIVGTNGHLILDDAELAEDLVLHGSLALSPDAVTVEQISAQLSLRPGASLALDLTAFETGQTDQLVFTEAQTLELDDIAVELKLVEYTHFFAGDSFTFAETPNSQPTQSIETIDIAAGRAVRLIAEGTELSVEAIHGSAISIRPNGAIGQVTLPAANNIVPALGSGDPDPSAPPTADPANLDLSATDPLDLPPDDPAGGNFLF
ncbi:MAG: hypothetical protein AAF415_09360 [Pseudomonadota bacterium]